MQEKFDLDEGPVTLSVPSVLSPESYQDLADRIAIFLRGLKRRSDAEAALRGNEGGRQLRRPYYWEVSTRPLTSALMSPLIGME
jgi:hypothetical protein